MKCVFLCLLLFSGQAYAFSFEDFVKVLEDRKITNLPDAIAALPEELRSSYDLMSASMSAQPSSPQFPRALLFGTDAKLIVAFNGDPQHVNYDRLEFLQFRDSREFELRFIQFGKNGVKVSEKNPRACTACHGEDPRPIWGSYNDWAGSFTDFDRIVSGSPEAEDLQSFLAHQRDHERYRHLIREAGHPFFPFAESGGPDFALHSYRPGNRLGNLLGRMLAQHAADKVLTSEYFRAHRATVMLGLIGTTSLSYDLPVPCLARNEEWSAFDTQISREFARAYAPSDYPYLYEELESRSEAVKKRSLMLQKLLLGPDGRWDFNRFAYRGKVGESSGYSLGDANMTGFVAARVMELASASWPELRPYYHAVDARGLFGEDYVREFVAPHDHWYDQAGLFYDLSLARGACEQLLAAAREEWKR